MQRSLPAVANKAEKQWMSDLSALGCVVCRNLGHGESPAEIHHLKIGCGIGQRSTDFLTIPLCPQHHRLGGDGIAFHANSKLWQEKYGDEIDLLTQTIHDVGKFRESIFGRAV